MTDSWSARRRSTTVRSPALPPNGGTAPSSNIGYAAASSVSVARRVCLLLPSNSRILCRSRRSDAGTTARTLPLSVTSTSVLATSSRETPSITASSPADVVVLCGITSYTSRLFASSPNSFWAVTGSPFRVMLSLAGHRPSFCRPAAPASALPPIRPAGSHGARASGSTWASRARTPRRAARTSGAARRGRA